MTDKEYETTEIRRAQDRLYQIEKAPLAERKEGRTGYAESLTVPGIMARNTAWLLDGSYGYGEMLLAHRLFLSPRANTVAALGIMLAAWDHSCPSGFARQAWNALPKDHQERVETEIISAILDWKAESMTSK
jgi:hypothetical protein